MFFRLRTIPVVLVVSLWTLRGTSAMGGNIGFKFGSCSNKCSSPAGQAQVPDTSMPLFHCSCSSSCPVYGDCCYDSPYRTEGNAAKRDLVCLSVSKKGQFGAIASCSPDWTGPSEFCTTSFGHLPPVTSKRSGTTYTNVHCAICNGDEEDLVTWNTELRCCPHHKKDPNDRRYVYHNGHLWSVKAHSLHPNRKCLCRYHPHYDDFSVLDSLELRVCELNAPPPRCPLFWADSLVEALCRSYEDPVYYGNRAYRNQHCAHCHLEPMHLAGCLPSVVRGMLDAGVNLTEIVVYCRRHSMKTCLNYFNDNRGVDAPFWTMFNMTLVGHVSSTQSTPITCGPGRKLDERTQKCRRLAQRKKNHGK